LYLDIFYRVVTIGIRMSSFLSIALDYTEFIQSSVTNVKLGYS